MPVKIEKRICIRRIYFVQGSKEKKSFNLVRWNTLVINKKDGGMGRLTK